MLYKGKFTCFRRLIHVLLSFYKQRRRIMCADRWGTAFFVYHYRLKRDQMIESKEDGITWEDGYTNTQNRFIGFRQKFSEKTVAGLNSSVTVTYPTWIVIVNVSEGYPWKLANHGHTLLAFMPATGYYNWVPEEVSVRRIELACRRTIEDEYWRATSNQRGHEKSWKGWNCCREQWMSWWNL